MGVRGKVLEVVPFIAMVTMEGCTIGLTILAKTAITGGMSPLVFVVYTNALGSILLLPYSILFHRYSPQQSIFTFPLLMRIFFLGFTGIFMAQNLAFLGLSYSSPIVVCVMGLLLPAISFILSLILRTKERDWRRTSFQVKVVGTIVSIMGATVVEIYKGPYIRTASSSCLQQHNKPHLFVYLSTADHWVLGGILLAASSLCVSAWNIIQLGTVKQYPHVMKVVSFYSLAGTIQCVVFSLFVERDPSAWKVNLNMDLLLIVTTAIFVSVIRSSIHITCSTMKGPLYVPMFKPFGIAFATFFGVTFFTNSLHYGSVMGAVITGMGYYTVMWGQLKEGEDKEEYSSSLKSSEDSSDMKVPLLQEDLPV
ncbi:nodulin MtN21 family protein [Tripterygium wilfordii]|uniref:WAT1-related protein n=1 Tax=Tripterygium wilfordii TaxID=458696 RepID=A0A7J7DK28_TRIWF|nr:WAT1-related protein At1g70260-like [Tripterygium wilfordii]KAF5746629.1 nodulin MtN21 family protein [Tripterygium wilfordii]